MIFKINLFWIFVLLVVLKLTDAIKISWLIVSLPILIPFVIAIFVILFISYVIYRNQ